MKECSGAEAAGSSGGRREVLGSGAPSADAGEVMVVVQEHGILSVPEVKRPWVTPKGYLVGSAVEKLYGLFSL